MIERPKPFLKWPGGKRWLAPTLIGLIRERLTDTYREPFLGGGAVFFHLNPSRAVLSDINEDLINTYAEVRRQPTAIRRKLAHLPVSKDFYYRIRRAQPHSSLARAVRFLYLNRTCYSGLYRENSRGEFTVPFGGGSRTPELLVKTDCLSRAADTLKGHLLVTGDFEDSLCAAGQGDVVYCDPPYTVVHGNNGFRRYNEKLFSWYDQERLAKLAREARTRGATVLISNALHPAVQELYSDTLPLKVSRQSTVSRQREYHRRVLEAIYIFSP